MGSELGLELIWPMFRARRIYPKISVSGIWVCVFCCRFFLLYLATVSTVPRYLKFGTSPPAPPKATVRERIGEKETPTQKSSDLHGRRWVVPENLVMPD